jgi:ABC-type multidrug transport system fused ATPase/permease subunit
MKISSPVVQAFATSRGDLRRVTVAAGASSASTLANGFLLRMALASATNPVMAIPWIGAYVLNRKLQGVVVDPYFGDGVERVGNAARVRLWKRAAEAWLRHRRPQDREANHQLFAHMDEVHRGWSDHVPWLMMNGLSIAASVAGAAVLGGPLLGGALLAATGGAVVVGWRGLRRTRDVDKKRLDASAHLRSAMDENSLELLRSLGRSDLALERVEETSERESSARGDARAPRRRADRWRAAAEVLFDGGVLAFGLLTGNPFLAVGAGVLARQAFGAVNTLPENLMKLGPALQAKRRMDEYLRRPPAIVDKPAAVDLSRSIREGVTFENVAFGYGDGKQFLRHVTFEAKAGEVVALLGRNAAGKSTLLELAQRNLDPQLGRITIDGVDLRDASLRSIDRLTAGHVAQRSLVMDGESLRENLRLVNPAASDVELRRVCQLTGLDRWMTDNGHGLDAVISNETLSGGTRQRVALARMLLNPPSLAILDEPTSALDAASRDAVLMNVIETLRANGSTVLLVTHDSEIARRADRAVLLDDGFITAAGHPEDVLRRYGDLGGDVDLASFDRERSVRAPAIDRPEREPQSTRMMKPETVAGDRGATLAPPFERVLG